MFIAALGRYKWRDIVTVAEVCCGWSVKEDVVAAASMVFVVLGPRPPVRRSGSMRARKRPLSRTCY